MNLTESINDIVEQAASLLSPPNMDDWTPPADAGIEDAMRLEAEEIDRRMQARLDRYLADRSDRLSALRAIHRAATERAAAYKAQSEPWLRLSRRQESIAEYVVQLASNVLRAERASAGMNVGEPYKVSLLNGVNVGLRITRVVQITDLDMLPSKLVRTKTTREADKVAIKTLLLRGEVVPGARLGTNEHVDWGR